MPDADHWTIVMVNDNVSELNYAEFGIETSFGSVPEATDAERLAQIIAYTACAAGQLCAEGTRIIGVKFRATDAEVSTMPPFPVAEYAALQTANVDDFPWLIEMDAYGEDIGDSGSGLQALGTSVVVTEYSDTGGPSGRGRHFIPFVNGTCVSSGGYLATAIRSTVALCYRAFIQGATTSPLASGTVNLAPLITNAAHTTTKAVENVVVQPVFSNLRSRRR
ncbi:MAG: hypothetical protein ACOYB2_19925 [Limnohabitans sp.]